MNHSSVSASATAADYFLLLPERGCINPVQAVPGQMVVLDSGIPELGQNLQDNKIRCCHF